MNKKNKYKVYDDLNNFIGDLEASLDDKKKRIKVKKINLFDKLI